MQTRVWWMRWQERGEVVEVMACRGHCNTLLVNEATRDDGQRGLEAIADANVGHCELCETAREVGRWLDDIPVFPGNPERWLRPYWRSLAAREQTA